MALIPDGIYTSFWAESWLSHGRTLLSRINDIATCVVNISIDLDKLSAGLYRLPINTSKRRKDWPVNSSLI